MPPREKGAKACLQDWAGHFLRSGLNVKDAELRPFLAILRAIQDFSALQTVWRSGQSGANLSLPKFPANREFNRELWKNRAFKTALFLSNPHISEERHFSGEKPSREFSGAEQGIIRDLQGFTRTDQRFQIRGTYEAARLSCRGSLNQEQSGARSFGRRESQPIPLLDPTQGNVLT